MKPDDYEIIINSKGEISPKMMIDARVYWKNVQSEEIKNARELMPNLLKEQLPIK
jgi:hypothetical protein